MNVLTLSAELTPKQMQIWEFLQDFIEENGYPPTYDEIREQFQLSAIGTVQDHLSALERKGFIQRLKDKARGIVLLKHNPWKGGIPILGTVQAGFPVFSYENFDGVLHIDDIVGKGYDRFALRVEGDSMIEAGINEGDYVIVRKQNVAQNGDIVVARVEDRVTVKRFFRKRNSIVLKPENKHLQPFVYPAGANLEILGKVVGLFRQF